jgi:anti-anti-sigma factor
MYDTTIEITTIDQTCVVTVKSDIDIANAETFRRYLSEASANMAALVVSLEDCPYIDSSGLRPLLGFAAARPDAFFVVVPRRASIRRIFDVTHLDEVIDVCESLPEALAKIDAKSKLKAVGL